MDIRSKIIQDVQTAMCQALTDEQLFMLKNVLTIQLNNYEIQNRCTSLTISDDSNDGILRRFIATKRIEGKSERTLERYYFLCFRMIHSIQKPISEITTYDLRFYLAQYKETRGVSNSTLDGMRRCFKSFFSWAFAEEVIQRNPSSALSQIKCEKVIRKPFSTVDIELLKRSCQTKRDRAIVEFLYSTGCRVSETVQLDRTDINFSTKEVVVNGKGNKQRVVYLSDVCALYLSEYLNSRSDLSSALFVGRGGKRLKKSGIEAALKRIAAVAGVENVHPHRYRRTLATNMLDRGASIQDVAKILGHEDITTTQVYCHISQSNVKSSFKKVI